MFTPHKNSLQLLLLANKNLSTNCFVTIAAAEFGMNYETLTFIEQYFNGRSKYLWSNGSYKLWGRALSWMLKAGVRSIYSINLTSSYFSISFIGNSQICWCGKQSYDPDFLIQCHFNAHIQLLKVAISATSFPSLFQGGGRLHQKRPKS